MVFYKKNLYLILLVSIELKQMSIWNLSSNFKVLDMENIFISILFFVAMFRVSCNFSLVARYSLNFTRCLLLVVKSLVTHFKIVSLLVVQFACCKKSFVSSIQVGGIETFCPLGTYFGRRCWNILSIKIFQLWSKYLNLYKFYHRLI